jgi:hypothetical protein
MHVYQRIGNAENFFFNYYCNFSIFRFGMEEDDSNGDMEDDPDYEPDEEVEFNDDDIEEEEKDAEMICDSEPEEEFSIIHSLPKLTGVNIQQSHGEKRELKLQSCLFCDKLGTKCAKIVRNMAIIEDDSERRQKAVGLE